MARRAPRRPAPPSIRVAEDVPWSDPADVGPPWWRRVLSFIELAILVVVLGVLLTVALGVTLVAMFFLVDLLLST